MEIGGKVFPVSYFTAWYALLWLLYLDTYPDLVEYARKFDDFRDSFARPGRNSQVEMIRLYVKQGREALLGICSDLPSQLGIFIDHRP